MRGNVMKTQAGEPKTLQRVLYFVCELETWRPEGCRAVGRRSSVRVRGIDREESGRSLLFSTN